MLAEVGKEHSDRTSAAIRSQLLQRLLERMKKNLAAPRKLAFQNDQLRVKHCDRAFDRHRRIFCAVLQQLGCDFVSIIGRFNDGIDVDSV